MMVSRIVNSFYQSCTWVLDGVGIVDCGDVEPLLQNASELRGVLLTHGHYDHIYGLNELCEQIPDITVYCSEWTKRQLLDKKLNVSYYHEMPFVFAYPERIHLVEDGDLIDLGNDVKVTAVSTPGHTLGCITWMTDDALFTGDSYIPGVKVVTRLPYGNKLQGAKSIALIQSLASKGRTICPGHSIEHSNQMDSLM